MINSKFILSLIVVLSITTCLYSQEKNKVIDFENHLTIDHIEKIEALIKESGVEINIVFFNVDEILGFKLKEPRSVENYITLWKENNKNSVLVLFSNIESNDDNYWTDNFYLVSTFQDFKTEEIQSYIVQEMNGLKYSTQGKSELQQKYNEKIKEIINLILNEKFKAITIDENVKSESFGAGFEFPSTFKASDTYKANPNSFSEEFAIIRCSIKTEIVKFMKVRVYSEPGSLVFEQKIDPITTDFKWDGKMNQGINSDKFITREMSKFLNKDNEPVAFKVELIGSKTESFDIPFSKCSYLEVHEEIKKFLEVINKRKNFHNNISLYSYNYAKNQFRRYIQIKDELRERLFLFDKNIDPLQYLSENIIYGSFFCSEDSEKHKLALHQDFVDLINRLETKDGQKINFSKDYPSGGGLNIRQNVNSKSNLSDHSLGIAFDLNVLKDMNTSSSGEFKNYIHALTKTSIDGKLESTVLKTVSDNFFEATSARTGIENPTSKDKNEYINLIKGIGRNMTFISSCFFNVESEKYEPGYAILNFFNTSKHDLWNVKFIEAQEAVSSACNNSLIIVNESKKSQALKLCSELINELYGVMSTLQNHEIESSLNAFNDAFFLKEKSYSITPLIENIAALLEYIKTMSNTLDIYIRILNQNYNEPLDQTIFSQTYILHNYGRVNITNSYNKTLKELMDINNILSKANISYKEIGTKFSTSSFAGSDNIYYVFMYGFVNFEQDELDNWLEFDFLEWMGHNKSNKDAMHFQLKPEYKKEFFSDTKNFKK